MLAPTKKQHNRITFYYFKYILINGQTQISDRISVIKRLGSM